MVERTVDLETGLDLPPTDGLVFYLSDGGRIIVRPSGTEPKIKAYLQVVVTLNADVEQVRNAADRQLQELADYVAQWFAR